MRKRAPRAARPDWKARPRRATARRASPTTRPGSDGERERPRRDRRESRVKRTTSAATRLFCLNAERRKLRDDRVVSDRNVQYEYAGVADASLIDASLIVVAEILLLLLHRLL